MILASCFDLKSVASQDYAMFCLPDSINLRGKCFSVIIANQAIGRRCAN